jgi:hypothetical protein
MQKAEYFVDERFIGRVKLHGPGHGLHMHQDQRRTMSAPTPKGLGRSAER